MNIFHFITIIKFGAGSKVMCGRGWGTISYIVSCGLMIDVTSRDNLPGTGRLVKKNSEVYNSTVHTRDLRSVSCSALPQQILCWRLFTNAATLQALQNHIIYSELPCMANILTLICIPSSILTYSMVWFREYARPLYFMLPCLLFHVFFSAKMCMLRGGRGVDPDPAW